MREYLQTPTAQIVLLISALAAAVVVGFYVVDKLRRSIHDTVAGTPELIENFRDLHGEGQLNDEEYRTIRSMLAERLRTELNDKANES